MTSDINQTMLSYEISINKANKLLIKHMKFIKWCNRRHQQEIKRTIKYEICFLGILLSVIIILLYT